MFQNPTTSLKFWFPFYKWMELIWDPEFVIVLYKEYKGKEEINQRTSLYYISPLVDKRHDSLSPDSLSVAKKQLTHKSTLSSAIIFRGNYFIQSGFCAQPPLMAQTLKKSRWNQGILSKIKNNITSVPPQNHNFTLFPLQPQSMFSFT